MTSQLPFTALLLAHRYDEKLKQAIASLSCAEQIIVGWNGGLLSEKQKAALHKLHERLILIEHTFPSPVTDFSAARNALQAHAQTDWILWLDSDEELDAKSIPAIAEVLSKPDLNGVNVTRTDVFYGQQMHWGEVRHVRLLRLFRRSSGHFIRPVHEVAQVTGKVTDAPITIYHFAHDHISGFFTKVVQYATLEAQIRFADGKHTSIAELILWPLGKFMQNVFLKQALRDGWRGVVYATMMSIHSLCVRIFLLEKYVTAPEKEDS